MRRMCVLAGCLLLLLAGCAPQTEYTHTFFAMDTVCSLRLPQKGEQEGEELSEAVQQLVAQLEGLWSKSLLDSGVSRLNAGESLTLEGRTAALLVRSAELCTQTGGAFSPLLGRLTALWDVQNAVRPPQQEQIEALLPVPDADLLQNAAQPGFSLPEGACLDLGGIAKGAAGAAGAQLLRGEGGDSGDQEYDAMFPDAVEAVVDAGLASVSLLPRRLKLGYSRAARIVDEMESRGIVGPYEGSKPRKVLITRQQWQEMSLNMQK